MSRQLIIIFVVFVTGFGSLVPATSAAFSRTERSVSLTLTHSTELRAGIDSVASPSGLSTAPTRTVSPAVAIPCSTRLTPRRSVSAESVSTQETGGTAHSLAASYYSTLNSLEARLTLNNKGITNLNVSVDLYSLSGNHLALPVEIVSFGARHTVERIAKQPMVERVHIRLSADGSSPYRTDSGHFIAEATLRPDTVCAALHLALKQLLGVVETGLFCHEASIAMIGRPDGSVRTLYKSTSK